MSDAFQSLICYGSFYSLLSRWMVVEEKFYEARWRSEPQILVAEFYHRGNVSPWFLGEFEFV